jgi:hypothetical protein
MRIELDHPRRLGQALLDIPAVVGVTVHGDGIQVETNDLSALGSLLPGVVRQCAVRVTRFESVDASLESVFRHLLRSRVWLPSSRSFA